MIRRLILVASLAAILAAGSAAAQIRAPAIVQRILPGTRPQQPLLIGINALRADFALKSGTDTVYFGGDSPVLGAPARQTLALQAAWLRQHPEVVVRIEGHAMAGDTRDHALAIGARRAEAVRDLLVLMGVPAAQLSAVSIGKERPVGLNARAVTVLVR